MSGLSPDPNRLGIAPLPDKVEIKTDAQTVMADLKEYTFNRVALSGKPVRSVTLKIAWVRPGKAGHACITGVRMLSPGGVYYSFVYGFDKAALDGLDKFATALDAAFQRCAASGFATSIKFPVKYQHDVLVPMGDAPPSNLATYKTAEELAKACRGADSPLSLGLAGGTTAALADDLKHPIVEKLGQLRLGDWQSHHWMLAWESGPWLVTSILTSRDALDDPVKAIGELVDAQLDVWGKHDAQHYDWYFAPGATIALLGPTASVVKASDAGDALRGVVGATKRTAKDVAVGLARDRKSGWLSFTVKLAAPGATAEFRVSEVVVRTADGWKIQSGLWSEAQANAAVNKSALADSTPKIAPIKNSKPDNDVLGAFLALQKGPLDATAASRKDLVVFGSGSGERTVGGAGFAKPWAASWANHVPMMGDAIAQKTPSGTTGCFLGDIALEKPKPSGSDHYFVPFHLFLVFDRTLDGAWTLVHAHIATPSP